jgi:hypothetical protein
LCTPPENDQVMLETCRGHDFNKLKEKCITLVLLYLFTMTHGQQNIEFKNLSECLCSQNHIPSAQTTVLN